MGTSFSHRSPSTPSWRAVSAAYLNASIPEERVVEEIWKAATNQPHDKLASSLSEPIIYACLKVALESDDFNTADYNVSKLIAMSGEASLATDIAKRAVLSSFLEVSRDKKRNFIKLLFSNTADYLISRDIPSYFGRGSRLENMSSTIQFKEDLKRLVVNRVNDYELPDQIEDDPQSWKRYVEGAISYLRGETNE
ncbi:hypothetical protein ACFLX8_03420 [Chloroflexota bacterium]